MRPIRVGLVCGYLDPTRDGVADYTRRLAAHLRGAGVDAVVCTTHEWASAHGDGAVGVTRRWDLPGVVTAARALRRLNLDHVHVQFAPSVFGGSRAVGLLPLLLPQHISVVVTLHEYGVRSGLGLISSRVWRVVEGRGYGDRETLLLAPRASCCLVPSPENREVLVTRFGRHAPVSVEVPIGLNVEVSSTGRMQARVDVRRSLGAAADAPLVVFFGFLHPEKALDRLIAAMAEVRVQHPDAQLLLIGGAESHSVPSAAAQRLRAELDLAAARCGMQEYVHFTGYLPDKALARLLQAADAAAFPFNAGVTRKSGSLLAALAAGVPVVATAPEGVLREPTEAASVLRVPPRDTAALAAALNWVLADGALADRLRAAGRAVVASQSWEAIVAAHAQIYAGALSPRGQKARKQPRWGLRRR